MKERFSASKIALSVFLGILSVVYLWPLVVVVFNSFKSFESHPITFELLVLNF